MAPYTTSSVSYHRDDAALTLLAHITETSHGHTSKLSDLTLRTSVLEDGIYTGGPGIDITNNDISIDFSEFDTDNITEGTTKLFHTSERVDDRVNNLLQEGTNITLTYDDANGTLTIDATDTNTEYTGGNGINITNNDISIDFSEFDTDNITEGTTKLFHTSERVDDRVNNLLQEGTNITLTYDDANGTLTIDATSSTPTITANSGDVIIGDGAGGIFSTTKLNVNPSNGYITGDFVNVNQENIKLGQEAGFNSSYENVSIGYQSGSNAGPRAVSIGSQAGQNAGNNSVSIGHSAKAVNNNSIVINATGTPLSSVVASSCYIDPLRDITVGSLPGLPFIVHYDGSTKEMFKAVDLQTRNAFVKGYLIVDSTASIYGGQLKVGDDNKITAGGGNNNLVVDLTTQRVGINNATPTTELDVNGEARISNNGIQTLSFYDTAHSHEHGTVETHQDGTGARMEFSVKNASSGAITRRLNINETGSIAIGSTTNYGTTNQVLTSNGNAPPSWNTPTAPTPDYGFFWNPADVLPAVANTNTPITQLTYRYTSPNSANNISITSGRITFSNQGLYYVTGTATFGAYVSGGHFYSAIVSFRDFTTNTIITKGSVYDTLNNNDFLGGISLTFNIPLRIDSANINNQFDMIYRINVLSGSGIFLGGGTNPTNLNIIKIA